MCCPFWLLLGLDDLRSLLNLIISIILLKSEAPGGESVSLAGH